MYPLPGSPSSLSCPTKVSPTWDSPLFYITPLTLPHSRPIAALKKTQHSWSLVFHTGMSFWGMGAGFCPVFFARQLPAGSCTQLPGKRSVKESTAAAWTALRKATAVRQGWGPGNTRPITLHSASQQGSNQPLWERPLLGSLRKKL